MSCDRVQQFLLDAGWDAGRRTEIAELLGHAEQCDACRAALEDYDALRRACAPANDDVPEPQGGWDAMEHRLTATIMPPQRKWLHPMMKIAAALVLAGGGFEVSRLWNPRPDSPAHRETRESIQPSSHPSETPAAVAVIAPLSPPVVSQATHKFGEISRKGYDGRAGWMLVSGSGTSVGVVPQADLLAKQVILLRLVLVRGERSIAKSDLVVRAGREADLTIPLKDGQSLHYKVGTTLAEPTHLTLSLALKTPNGREQLAALGTDLYTQPGKNLTMGKLTTSCGEYELLMEFASANLAEGEP